MSCPCHILLCGVDIGEGKQMKLFLSHSSRQKLLVREIKERLPDFIDIWIDEKDVLVGDDLTETIYKGIDEEADYVILFLDDHAAKSSWVRKEIEWAIEKETAQSRTILLPFLIDKSALSEIPEFEISKRKYVVCHDFSEESINSSAMQLTSELFALEVRMPKPSKGIKKDGGLDAAEKTFSNYARAFREEIYPYRRNNPISMEELLEKFKSKPDFSIESKSELVEVLEKLKHTHMLSGYYFDDDYAFLASERVDQKRDLNVEAKRSIARAAARMIESDMIIALDSGSTASELATELCGLIEARLIYGLKMITTSIPAASIILDCLNRIEANDRDTTCQVYLLGGFCRPISLSTLQKEGDRQIKDVLRAENIDGIDIAFLGANGVFREEGLANDSSALIATKREFHTVADKSVGLLEARKLQIQQRSLFAPFCDKLTLITYGDLAAFDTDFITSQGTKIKNVRP